MRLSSLLGAGAAVAIGIALVAAWVAGAVAVGVVVVLAWTTGVWLLLLCVQLALSTIEVIKSMRSVRVITARGDVGSFAQRLRLNDLH